MPDMPNTVQGVHKRAKREGWHSRKLIGVQGPGVEYYISVYEKADVKSDVLVSESDMKTNPDISILADEFVLIPGYSVQVSLGHGAAIEDTSTPSRYLAFRKKWLKYRGFSQKDLVIVWAKGDSMEPTIHNNDSLVIHTGRTKLVDGHIYVFRSGDSYWAKRVQVRATSWLLISDNEIYPPIEIKLEEQADFEVVGQVVHIAHDLGD